jgi:hypothetical protein
MEWNNQGGNGKASAVWVARDNGREAQVHVMPYRCLVDTWQGKHLIQEGTPFDTWTGAKEYAEKFLKGDV